MKRGGECHLSRITYVLRNIFRCEPCGFEGAKELSFKPETSNSGLELDLLWETSFSTDSHADVEMTNC